MKLLIIDDSKAMQAIVLRGLAKFKHKTFNIKKASNGKDALAIIKEWEPDIILSDWHMPNMTGLELLSIIKKRNLPIKIGLVTTEKDEGRLTQARKLGAEFVLAKPFDDASLHKAILPLIHKKQANSFVLPKSNLLQQALKRNLSLEVNLTECAQQKISSQTLPCIVALFEDETSKRIRSIALLDLNISSAIAEQKSTMTKVEIVQMLAQNNIPTPILECYKKLLRDCAIALTTPGSKQNLKFKNMLVLSDNLQKVETLFNKPAKQRLDFLCQIENFENGYMTIIAS